MHYPFCASVIMSNNVLLSNWLLSYLYRSTFGRQPIFQQSQLIT